ncbi:MAG TPA: DNA-binding protein [Candidatus Nitrosotalea sp.]|nr:DNA-binding protein [Candidatus Nitrosotalea sp.]
MTEEDKELELLKAKRMLEMQKNISQRQRVDEKPQTQAQKVSPRDVVLKQLGYRGEEVLQNAESQFPNETKVVIEKLAELIQGGEVTEVIDGGKLLTLFRSVGIHVRIQTTINVEQDGKMVSWSDKLKGETKQFSESVSDSVSSDDSPVENV